MAFLYIFIPNTKVRLKSALVGGILAGSLWQGVQWGYIYFQVGVANYNAIYGTLAVLPIFMVWIYTSWLIVMFGVELVCAHQNIRTFRREIRISASYGLKELFALAILQSITEAFHYGKPPLSTDDISEELDIPLRLTRELLDILLHTGYLVQLAGDTPTYQPAREIEHIPVKDVLLTLKNFGGVYKITRVNDGEKLLLGLIAKAEAGAAVALSGVTIKDLIITKPAAQNDDGGNLN
jgi:membrane protein